MSILKFVLSSRGLLAAMVMVLLVCSTGFGQISTVDTDQNSGFKSQIVAKKFLIVALAKTYEEADAKAREISQKTKLKIDLRGHSKNDELCLSLSASECKKMGWDFPMYIPRGMVLSYSALECKEKGWDFPTYVERAKPDDGFYISIEHSNEYEKAINNMKDMYMVVAATGSLDDITLVESLKTIKKVIPDAFLVDLDVYVGSMHN